MSSTIFDDVFRTMVEKMPYLAVPLINEVFDTSYPKNVEITQLRNEHQQENGEVITDCCLKIGGKLYHIECQSMDDTTMAIRMIEYDFAIAIENVQKEGRRYRMELPRSCVLYLRSGSKIFEKDLLMLLPFYIMRYEKDIHEISENPRLFQQLLNEYEEIRRNLEDELSKAGKSKWYMDLNKLIIKISDYICQNEEKVRKGVGDIMGGKVLELESERLERIHREAMAKATAEAEIRGEARGEIKGEEKGEERLSTLINCLILDGRNAEVQLVTTDKETRQRLYKEYEI